MHYKILLTRIITVTFVLSCLELNVVHLDLDTAVASTQSCANLCFKFSRSCCLLAAMSSLLSRKFRIYS